MGISAIVGYCVGKRRILAVTALIVFLLFEVYLRIPFMLGPLEYQPDPELVSRLRPRQVGFVWLGNMSYQSAPVSINGDGHRGNETDWSRPVVLAVGDSESMGIGVGDGEVWSNRLQSLLHQKADFRDVQIVNASHPGSGPYHHYITMKRILADDKRDIRAIIVRVDIGDRYFKAPSDEQRREAMQKSEMKLLVKSYTKALPYLINKIEAQRESIRAGLRPWFIRNKAQQTAQTETVGRSMWEENRRWWDEMVVLSSSKNIPLVFMIGDVMGWPSTRFLSRQLDALSSENRHIRLFRLGKEALGLKEEDPELLWKEFNMKMTLGRDPHANPTQHQLIAESLYKYFTNEHLLGNQHSFIDSNE